ncbi:hypothetical protein LO763_10520 [Glycomyces sp. A-F 0318]|uniref:hypothetical protein n=1 Tax=Glycomyces amatae TaxID=2881355 RepID=UPI001E2E6F25|nr:hypothetical protein [Glycomyces amatae]MCD0444057.1 hypothetical protein [Glycomyces amatae]
MRIGRPGPAFLPPSCRFIASKSLPSAAVLDLRTLRRHTAARRIGANMALVKAFLINAFGGTVRPANYRLPYAQ